MNSIRSSLDKKPTFFLTSLEFSMMIKVGILIIPILTDSSLNLSVLTFMTGNISACGEIKELYSSVGTISTIGETKYLVTVPKGTNEVTLTGTTDYTWVKGYEPRTVSTKNGNVELKVDGN